MDEGVEGPKSEAGRVVWDVCGSGIGVEEVKGNSEAEQVLKDVKKGLEDVSLEAVAGNAVVDFFDCVVRDGELVSIQVDELAILFTLG